MTEIEVLRKHIADDVMHDMDAHVLWIEANCSGNILEIGVRTGISTAALLLGIQRAGGYLYSADIENKFGTTFGNHPNWTFIHSDSKDTSEILPLIPDKLDVLFVDGDHSYEGALADLNNYGPKVKSGGLIVCHDVTYLCGCTKAFDEYVSKTGYATKVLPDFSPLGIIYVS